MSLRKTIHEFIKEYLTREKIYSQVCSVVSVDSTNRVCQLTPINGDAQRKGRLQASLELTEGIYVVPVVGSYVILTFINPLTGVITKFSEIDQIEIKPQTKIVLKQGSETLDDLFEKQRAIQDDINDLKSIFSNWVVVPNDGGAALKTASSSWYGTDIEIIT